MELGLKFQEHLVNQYFKHINFALDTTPLVMVVGGYSAQRQIRDEFWKCTHKPCKTEKGRVNDVELLSVSKKKNTCSRFVNPLLGETRRYKEKDYKIKDEWEREGEIYGLTGAFSKDAAIVCGGRNGGKKDQGGDLNICWEWDSEINKYVF